MTTDSIAVVPSLRMLLLATAFLLPGAATSRLRRRRPLRARRT